MSIYPFIDVTVNGQAVSSIFYSRLVSARIHDGPGQDSDSITVRLDDARNELILPAKGDIMTVRFGFRDGASEKMGRFVLEQPEIEGGDEGEFITLNGRPADMREDIKETGSEHFDDETIGSIVETLAGRHGFDAKVSGAMAKIKIPYIARTNQSPVEFLTRLADRSGALFSIKDGKFLFLERGQLGAVTVHKSQCSSWRFSLNPRPILGKVEAGWFDRDKAEWVFESVSTGLEGPLMRLRQGLASQAEAKAAAQSKGDQQNRATASGSLELAGRPDIMADTPITTTGFRPEANGPWVAAGVDHVYDGTYTTSIELEAPNEGKT